MGRDLADGETAFIQGSAREPYQIKNTGGVYSCSCPAWRNQSLAIERRTCKHIKKLRGTDAEAERIGGELPEAWSKPAKESKAKAPVLLAQSWEPHVDVKGWWLSEKLDGVRAYWDGTQFLSRLGNTYHAPEWFTAGLPETPLDGELWIGRGEFQRTVSVVRRQDKSEHWREVSYLVFDAPDHGGTFEERMEWLRESFAENSCEFASLLDHELCEGIPHLEKRLAEIEAEGGEGVMARQPGSKYVAGRSHTLLKVKTFHDAEAIVTGHVAGAGRHKGRLGALRVELADGTVFSVGTGFSDQERDSPPAIGTVISFRYQELTKDGVPRFPAYLRVRPDAEWTRREGGENAKYAAKKKPEKKTVAKPTEAPATEVPPGGALRYLEFSDGKSNKFWEIRVAGVSHTVRYGRIGAKGTVKTKEFATGSAALADAEKLVAKKIAKGYEEKVPS